MPEEAINAAQELGGKVDRLAVSVDTLSEQYAADQKSAKRWRWLTGIITAVSVVTLGLVVAIVLNVRYSSHQAACVRDWANAYAARTNTLTPANTERADKLDDLIRTLPDSGSETQTERAEAFQQKLFAYLQASDKYQNLVQTNPPPVAPQFTC